MQKTSQQQLNRNERNAFGLSMLGALALSQRNQANEMATTINQQAGSKAQSAIARHARFVATLCPTSVYSIHGYETNPAQLEPSFRGSDWDRSHRIRGGIPLVANG